jgi:hypothetical protein
MRRYVALAAISVAALFVAAVPASAQVVQGFQIGGGSFSPKGYDARPVDDVLVVDLNSLSFNLSHFNGGQIFGEYNLDFGKHIEVGAGLGYYRRTTQSIDRNNVNAATGNDIFQNLRLRIIPISGVVRFMPVGRPGHAQPYVGAGFAVLQWRYSEFGDFVDANSNIFKGAFVGSGSTPAGIVLGGIRLPLNGDVFALMAEVRYQWATGNLNPNDFLSNKIDLSGTSLNFAFQVRY